MKTSIIYIKYADELSSELFEEVKELFGDYNWGAGFSLSNFRLDERFVYCDMNSGIYDLDSRTSQQIESYIQGMISGYLIANGVEIL
jgi:hypothetical protein